MPNRLLPAAFVLMDLVDDPGIDLETCIRCLFVEAECTGQGRILQAGKGRIDALLNCITLDGGFFIGQVSSSKLFDVSTKGSGCLNKNT